MSSDLTLDFENHRQYPVMDSEAGIISIDQEGEWDLSLFDELEKLGDELRDADELLEALDNAGYANGVPDLDFDIDIPPWNEMDTCSISTDGEVSVDSLSPAHTLSSVPSPASVEALSPCSLQDEALSPQSQPSPLSVCSESSGFSEISSPPRKAAKRTNQVVRAKPVQPVKKPIQIGPKVSIQPKPLITAVPLAQAAAPMQAKTIIIQPLQTTVLPVVKPAPVNIKPAPPSKLSQRQQRMIKNRESASLSRKKKKEYLLSLEARLKVALSENEVLKSENGNLKKQLEGLLSKNTALKASAPKRRAVCLMVVVVFLVLNAGPMSLFQGGPGSSLEVASMQHSSRHLLGFSPEAEIERLMGPDALGSRPSEMGDRSEDKALMVVKDPIFVRPSPPCQPSVNRTKCIELAHELRGWVHRHEVQQTKSRRENNSNHKPTRTILKTGNKEDEGRQIVTVQYTETTAEKKGSKLIVKGIFIIKHIQAKCFVCFEFVAFSSFQPSLLSSQDHLLLPATSHNKGSPPKMSVVLPAMNINDSIIRDKDFEVMMQIDCVVTDTRILHIRSSSIPPLLRVNRTDTFYQNSPAENKVAPPVGVLMGSA
ncbi:cyclic AMP-dependent transcription factor ATF-6 alpha [Neolamprologus brichardi]|uniref:cyclic AMP-dependent transcription factor ATF-6 alpha n=1 Tax=Neolamprologus brichardi TaxID=32507 RepID=UPI001643F8B0|nr:cyclic AMP-dependent transcription factor ATF-6 alpha [Neolamprologus brichardi]